MSKEKAVAVKNETSLTEAVTSIESRAAALSKEMSDLGISASDLVIPKLMLMQNTSEYVGDEKAELGDIINSQTTEPVGGINSPVEFIPLKLFKTWRVYDMSSKQPKFLRQESLTAQNEKLPWEDVEEIEGKNVPIRRDACMNFFVLLKKDVDSGEAFPAVVSFKRTSLQAGKQIATHLFKMAVLGRKPYAKSLVLKVVKQKKDTNTWAAFTIADGLELSTEQKNKAEEWLGNLASMNYRVDEADDETPEAEAAAPVKPVVVGSVTKGDMPY